MKERKEVTLRKKLEKGLEDELEKVGKSLKKLTGEYFFVKKMH